MTNDADPAGAFLRRFNASDKNDAMQRGVILCAAGVICVAGAFAAAWIAGVVFSVFQWSPESLVIATGFVFCVSMLSLAGYLVGAGRKPSAYRIVVTQAAGADVIDNQLRNAEIVKDAVERMEKGSHAMRWKRGAQALVTTAAAIWAVLIAFGWRMAQDDPASLSFAKFPGGLREEAAHWITGRDLPAGLPFTAYSLLLLSVFVGALAYGRYRIRRHADDFADAVLSETYKWVENEELKRASGGMSGRAAIDISADAARSLASIDQRHFRLMHDK